MIVIKCAVSQTNFTKNKCAENCTGFSVLPI